MQSATKLALPMDFLVSVDLVSWEMASLVVSAKLCNCKFSTLRSRKNFVNLINFVNVSFSIIYTD